MAIDRNKPRIETSWIEKPVSKDSKIMYNEELLQYNVENITYNGYFLVDSTNWVPDPETT